MYLSTVEHPVFLSPHIDDVAFSVGATLLDGRFSSATVINVFSLSRSAYDDDDVDRVSVARRQEDDRFFQNVQIPVKRLFLDRVDAPLRLMISDDDVCAVAPSDKDADEVCFICSLLERLRPEHTLLIAPLALGQHVDHVVVHRAACVASCDGWRVAFYEDLPYAFDLSLDEIRKIADETSAKICRPLQPHLMLWGIRGTAKLEAICAYESQIGPTTLSRIREHARRFGTAAERLWMKAEA